ncbi:MAG: family 20 glycosylhydrolase, partial [bacterium]|nr:family 20 glycosylhydrolase [bacterium]
MTDAPDSGLGTEGYELWAGGVVVVRANTSTGVFWGSRTLLQMLSQSADKKTIVRGRVRDWPSQGLRLIHPDMGRKFWEVAYLEDLMRQMSWHKLNMVKFHLSESEGFRLLLNSDDPDFAEYEGLADPASSYSKADIARLEAFAAEHHITIMPGLDFPGHATVIADHFNIGFGDGAGACTGSHVHGHVTPNWVIDMTSTAAANRVKQMITKFMSWFSGPYVHLGADEVPGGLGSCQRVRNFIRGTSGVSTFGDVMVRFLNDLNATVKGMGKRSVIYNGFENMGPSSQTLDSDIVIMLWENHRTQLRQQATRSGVANFDIINTDHSQGLYLTPNNYHHLYPNEARLYDQWTPTSTDLGTGVAIWADYLFWGHDEFFERLLRRGRAILADRTWNATPTPDTVSDFYPRIERVGSPPGFVGYQAPARIDDGAPSHHYPFERSAYPAGYHYAARGRLILMAADTVGGLHGTSYIVQSPTVDTTDKVVGSSSFVFDNDWDGVGLGGVGIEAPWSVSVWVKRTADRPTATLLSARDHLGRYRYIYVETGSQSRVGFRTPAGNTRTFAYTARLNTWTHLALVATAADTKLYANGALVGTVADSMTLPFDAIAARRSNGLRGKLDELKIWDEALSAAQVAADYRSRCPNSGLVHHWAFDETSGATASDAGSGDDDGTITGATRVTQGRLGGALRFDGNGDWVQVDADAIGVSGGCGGWTAALWVNRTADNADAVLFAPPSSGPVRAVVKLEQYNDTHEVGLTRRNVDDYAFGYSAPLNTWTHLTLVGTATDTKLYANGALVGTINQAFSLPLARIGSFDGTGRSYIDADLDDIRVYGHAKTATQVAALFGEVNVSPPDAPGEVTLSPASGQLTVAWLAPAGDGGGAVSGYVVAHKPASGQGAWSAPAAATGTLSHVISSLTDDTAYEVRVAAVNAAGRGAWSPAVTAAPSATVVAPGAPR